MFACSSILRSLARAGCLALAMFGCEADATAKDLGLKHGTQWTPYLEWTLPNASWEGSPFDLRASVVFTHDDSGEHRKTTLFYLGENFWAFRFSADKAGVWSFTTSSDDDDLAGHTGRMEIRPNAKRTAS